jgi:hypothetical protein
MNLQTIMHRRYIDSMLEGQALGKANGQGIAIGLTGTYRPTGKGGINVLTAVLATRKTTLDHVTGLVNSFLPSSVDAENLDSFAR